MPDLADQSRWNTYGTTLLDDISNNPDKYIFKQSPISHWSFYDDLIKTFGRLDEKRILELGCGTGRFSIYLAQQGASISGVDIGEDLILSAKALAKVNNVTCEFNQSTVINLPYPDNTFDIVFGLSILHHLSKTDVVLALWETSRVLKKEGVAVFAEPVENSWLFNFFQNLIPLGKPGMWGYRPSILQRKKWDNYIASIDDRDMTTYELLTATTDMFSVRQVRSYGFLSRLQRLIGSKYHSRLVAIDKFLFRYLPPLRFYSQIALVTYKK